jgi:hypothetical protein
VFVTAAAIIEQGTFPIVPCPMVFCYLLNLRFHNANGDLGGCHLAFDGNHQLLKRLTATMSLAKVL